MERQVEDDSLECSVVIGVYEADLWRKCLPG